MVDQYHSEGKVVVAQNVITFILQKKNCWEDGKQDGFVLGSIKNNKKDMLAIPGEGY